MAYDIRHILVPVDMSDAAAVALQYARLFSERLLAPVSVMYSDPLRYPMEVIPATAVVLSSTPETEARLREEITSYAKQGLESWPFDVIVKMGPPAPMILRTADEISARLIVIGTHNHRGWRHALVGSVTNDVIHGSECPVMTLSGRGAHITEHPAVTRILCPVNFTEVARDSLRMAAHLADIFAAELLVVHVNEPGREPIEEWRVRDWIAPEMRESAKFRELVLRGGPAERVLDCAEDLGADLLVIGAQHKLFRDTTVIGTTTERLIRYADCPVITFPRVASRIGTTERDEILVSAR
jgi:nucleotide-binding universal stress UspA family protein